MSGPDEPETLTAGEKLRALGAPLRYRPVLTAAVAVSSVLTALLEAVGPSFIVPILEFVRSSGAPPPEGSRLLRILRHRIQLVQSLQILEFAA